jgi:hypothetical protein
LFAYPLFVVIIFDATSYKLAGAGAGQNIILMFLQTALKLFFQIKTQNYASYLQYETPADR